MGRLLLMMNVTLDGCCDHTQVIADESSTSAWPAIASSVDGPQFKVRYMKNREDFHG